jgi:hypothetical protein
MKKLITVTIFAFLITMGTTTGAQNRNDEYLGLPGDNLNLYAVMKLFQESETLESFERSLNNENSRINNLDLNGDNMVDYITVSDYVDGNVHNIVLRVALSPNESQDVAVFTVERFRDGTVQIQLVGDEELYGKNYIIEPMYADNGGETPNPGYRGGVVYRTTYVEVAAWPLVRFMFYPDYIAWHSPWYWGCSFTWWNPWRPWYWHAYYGYHSHWFPHYYAHFRICDHYRYYRYHDYYYSHVRMHSPMMGNRIREGNYRHTYSRPELRREGANYARMNSGRNDGYRNSSNLSISSRNSGSATSRSRNFDNNISASGRRSSSISSRSSGNERIYSAPSANRDQRSSINMNNRSSERNNAVQDNISSRRSNAGSYSRNNAVPSASRNSGVSQRSSTQVTARSSGTPSVRESAGTHRSSTSYSARSSSESRSTPSYSARSSSGSHSSPSLKSAGSSSGRSSASVRSNSGGGRSSGGSASSGGGGGSHSSSGRSGRR